MKSCSIQFRVNLTSFAFHFIYIYFFFAGIEHPSAVREMILVDLGLLWWIALHENEQGGQAGCKTGEEELSWCETLRARCQLPAPCQQLLSGASRLLQQISQGFLHADPMFLLAQSRGRAAKSGIADLLQI